MKNVLKRLLSLALVAILIVALVACNDGADDQNGEEPTEKTVWLVYTRTDEEGNVYTYDYNEYGNEIRCTQKDPTGTVVATWINEYDENQNLTKTSVDTGKGEPFVQQILTYDENGRLKTMQTFTAYGEALCRYQYDAQNRLVAERRDGKDINVYIYEADGSYKVQDAQNEGNYSLYDKNGNIQESQDYNVRTVYIYNDKGVLVETVTYVGESVSSRVVRELDANGNVAKSFYVTASGNRSLLSEYEHRQYTVKTK